MKTTLRLLTTVTVAVVALFIAGAAARAQSPRVADTAALAARLQRLEDIEEIRTLLLDYGRHLDSRDLVAYSKLFARDGEWVGGFGSAKGPEEILAFMQKNLGTGPNRNNSFHILSNFEIDVKGDTATAWSRWTFVAPGADGKPVISQSGRYDDSLVREDGRWRFKRRSASNDIPAAR
ncbi:MAG TPA: nuclear transport factor 2 family protein [Terriglobia bacterium]|nr:nuclear transport factor 2 family protein [Terriglobia bacterium]